MSDTTERARKIIRLQVPTDPETLRQYVIELERRVIADLDYIEALEGRKYWVDGTGPPLRDLHAKAKRRFKEATK